MKASLGVWGRRAVASAALAASPIATAPWARIASQRASNAALRLNSVRLSRPVRPRSVARTRMVGLPALIRLASIRPTAGTSNRSTGRPVGSRAVSPPPGSKKSSTISAPGKATPGQAEIPVFYCQPTAHWHVGDDGFGDVGLPDAEGGDAVGRTGQSDRAPGRTRRPRR